MPLEIAWIDYENAKKSLIEKILFKINSLLNINIDKYKNFFNKEINNVIEDKEISNVIKDKKRNEPKSRETSPLY